ncbi:hypothetical protein NQZ68_020548 [Dissostichus eleginoides]|nr:hypothetical protein NQZ68_020548 [Dissostichus eleginoides]
MEGQRKGSVYQAQHGVAGKRKDGVDQPFPNKPVSHRRPLNPGKQDSLDLEDFEKITLTEQPRGPSFPPKYHSDGIGKNTGSRQTRKDSHIETSGELKMARAIHEKELMLQEKLWSVEEKVRQKYQRYAAAHEDPKSREQRNNRGQAERGEVQTKGGLFEQQRREPVEREIMLHDRRQEDVKQLRRMQDQRNDDRISIRHEEERETAEVQKEKCLRDNCFHQFLIPLIPADQSKGSSDRKRAQTPASNKSLAVSATECLQRTVFNIYVHRTKGSAIEEYWKTHTKSPEVLKKKTIRHPHKTNISNLEESRLPAGTSKSKWAK